MLGINSLAHQCLDVWNRTEDDTIESLLPSNVWVYPTLRYKTVNIGRAEELRDTEILREFVPDRFLEASYSHRFPINPGADAPRPVAAAGVCGRGGGTGGDIGRIAGKAGGFAVGDWGVMVEPKAIFVISSTKAFWIL